MPRILPSALVAVLLLAPVVPASAAGADPEGRIPEIRPEPRPSPESADPRLRILDAMAAELERNRQGLRIGDHPAPYFIAYTVRDSVRYDIQSRYGAVFRDQADRDRNLYVEVRVGDYDLDNSKVAPEGFFGSSTQATYISRKDAPVDDDLGALRSALWLSTDERYKEALSNYLKMRGERVYRHEEREAPSFSREKPERFLQETVPFDFDRARWQAESRRASRRFASSPNIFDNLIRVSAQKETRWIVNTEGARVLTEEPIFALHVSAVARAEDGMLLTHQRSFYGRTQDELPAGETLDREVDRLSEELAALRTAPVMDPYTGPAILAPEATGVLFHEAIGHRLEGERQEDEDGGRTFKGQIGRRVVPGFITVFDDPTLTDWQDTPLNGHYLYDDEGVKSRRTGLIDQGRLEGFLLSRTPVKDVPPHSNGHGRAQGGQDPMARMGNLVVVAQDGKAVTRRAELKKRLIAEARRQGKRYGLIIGDITGGDTNTSTYGYQAFRGVPTLAYRVDVETGAEELVRGVELVGTPLTVINKIVAASRETDVFNGYCGAESGFVLVSTVAPAVLITEVELQRVRRDAERSPVLPPPWAK